MNFIWQVADDTLRVRGAFKAHEYGDVILLFVVLTLAATIAGLPYFDALGFIVRAADLQGSAASLAAWRTAAVTREPMLGVPTRLGSIPARFYRPSGGFSRTIVLVPGVHRDGIDEARLVGLAQDLVATGFAVLTVAAPDLQAARA